MRTEGATNIPHFDQLERIGTNATSQIKHLSDIEGTPLKQFQSLLRHQKNYLNWIETRHDKIKELQSKLDEHVSRSGQGPAGAKDTVFAKYRWYSEQLVILEGINAFETFYKQTLTKLGTILKDYVHPSEDRVIRINARQLWSISGETVTSSLIPALVFENQIFHDLDTVDQATDMLIGQRRYQKRNNPPPHPERVKALRGIFQVRHTLSHNGGKVIPGDAEKFRDYGYTISENEIIDPNEGRTGHSIFKTIEDEAKDFNVWLIVNTANYLQSCINDRGLTVELGKQTELEGLLGSHSDWANVSWS